MKTLFSLFIYTFLLLVLFINTQIVSAQTDSTPNNFLKVEKLACFENFYQSSNWYIAGQPNLEQLNWLKEKGVTTIINLRSEDENKEFTKTAFSEELIAQQMGFVYYSIPIKGNESYNQKTLSQFADILTENDAKILIHCKGAGRATIVLMAYLIKHKNFTFKEAEAFGEQINYFSPIDGLLGNN